MGLTFTKLIQRFICALQLRTKFHTTLPEESGQSVTSPFMKYYNVILTVSLRALRFQHINTITADHNLHKLIVMDFVTY